MTGRADVEFACWHGFSDDGGVFDPPSADHRPSRVDCERFYRQRRGQYVEQFLDALEHARRGSAVARLTAWPVAEFDDDERLRAAARAELDTHARRRLVARDIPDTTTHTGGSR